MFLTLTFEVADVKNDDGQGKARRNATEKALKSPKRITRLSRHKQILLKEVAIAFSESYDHVVQWGIVHFGELPFRYALAKDGDPIVDREGNQKYGVCDAHYLANWLAVRIPISGLSARLKNGVYN